MFWGAPLIARELEAGTQRLAWMQSVTRFRWLAVKLGLAGLASMAVAGLLSLMVTWWSGPFDRIGAGRLDPAIFSERGIVPVGYAAFAFALGVTAGLLIRHTVPAMAVTLAVFAAVQAAFELKIRFHLIPPVRVASALNMAWVTETGTGGPAGSGSLYVGIQPNLPGAWIGSSQVTTAAGSTSLGPPLVRLRPERDLQRVHGRHRPDAPAAGDRLPAGQPVLGVAVVRDRDLPRPGPRPCRVLCLVGPTPGLMRARYATPPGRSAPVRAHGLRGHSRRASRSRARRTGRRRTA